MNVVIRGLKEDLDQLSAAALGAEMDVEDMVPGENSGGDYVPAGVMPMNW